ncbi:MAG: AzlD domain-containing protein [Gammaproteobacteria bacterium]|jgi:branched-subunit amino acid transport protein|nr:AzlD domain-containing protein [Gammaproteobacteria bacterium]
MGLNEWLIALAGVFAGSYALRAAPFLWAGFRRVGERNLHFLTYTSFAIAAGIVSKALLVSAGAWVGWQDFAIRSVAVVFSVLMLRSWRNVPVALFAGVGFAVLLKALVGGSL